MGKDAPPAARNGASKSPVKGSGSPAATAAAAQAAAEKGLPTQNSVVPVAVAANLGLGLRPRPNARPPATGATTTGPPPAKAIGAGTVTRPKAPKAPPAVRPDASAAKAAGAAPNSSSPPPRSGTGTVARPRAPSQGDEAKTSRDAGGTAARDGAPGERAGATAPSKSSTGERASAAATTAPVKSSTGERAGAAAPSKSSTGERASAAATTAPVKSSTGERAGATAPSKSSTGERASAATAAPVKSSTGTGVNRSSASPSGGAASTGGEPLGSSAVETSQTSSPSPAKAAGTAPAAKAPASTATVSNLPGRPGAPPPAGMLAILGGMSDFLSSVSNQATGGYSEEQRRGCIACALRLGKPELVNVLARLHSLAASCWSHSSSDSSAVKALAVLLGVSLAANKDSLEEAIAWRLARPPANAWRREHRLTALALLLKAPPKADSEAELVVKLLKSVVSMATAALCALLSASAGTTLDDAKQGAVLKLAEQVASGSVGKGKTYPGLEILGLLLGCDAKEAAILSHASNVAWAKTAQSAIKTVAIGFEMAEIAKQRAQDCSNQPGLRTQGRNSHESHSIGQKQFMDIRNSTKAASADRDDVSLALYTNSTRSQCNNGDVQLREVTSVRDFSQGDAPSEGLSNMHSLIPNVPIHGDEVDEVESQAGLSDIACSYHRDYLNSSQPLTGPLSPERSMHETHVRRLNRYLNRVEREPMLLEDKVDHKRDEVIVMEHSDIDGDGDDLCVLEESQAFFKNLPNSDSQATTTPSTATAPVAAPAPVAVAATGSPDAGKEVEAAPPKPVETKKAKDEDMESEKPDGWNALKALVEEADEEDEDEALEENDEEEEWVAADLPCESILIQTRWEAMLDLIWMVCSGLPRTRKWRVWRCRIRRVSL
eukprot:symbB.v1.2.021107.t1/scaffold1717.1/size104954/10